MKKIMFLFGIVILAWSCNLELPENKKIIVGVYNGNGVSPICVIETKEALKIDTGIKVIEISPLDIISGKLDSIDVLIFPGGSGSKELLSMGDLGAEKVKDFVLNQGKSIIGICAGGYLVSTTPTYPSLKLISAKNIDRKHYARGRGLIEFSLTEKGLEVFPELKGKRLFMQYYDGPILAPLDSNQIKYVELGKYVSDIHANKGIPSGITPGKTIILYENVGKGKVFVFGGHPEATPGYRWMIPRAVRFLVDSQIVKYNPKWIRPDIYSSELMFTDSLKKLEKKLYWQLFNDTAEVQISALEKLYQMHSRPSVRWSIGLLRDDNPQVRLAAAKHLQLTEYTWALPHLKQALKMETDSSAKKQIEEAIKFLSN